VGKLFVEIERLLYLTHETGNEGCIGVK